MKKLQSVSAFTRPILILDLILIEACVRGVGAQTKRHCRLTLPTSTIAHAMPSTVAQQFQTKLGAVSLFVESADDAAERIRQSELHTHTLIEFLLTEKLTKTDKDNCMAMVVSDERLEITDRKRLLTAINDAKLTRNEGQKWGAAILDIFTSSDWASWTERGAAYADDIMDEIIIRVRNLGGKNISEPDKKTLTAVWLHVCTGGNLGDTHQRRAIALIRLKKDGSN